MSFESEPPRFGTERSEVQILSPRLATSTTYGHHFDARFALRTHTKSETAVLAFSALQNIRPFHFLIAKDLTVFRVLRSTSKINLQLASLFQPSTLDHLLTRKLVNFNHFQWEQWEQANRIKGFAVFPLFFGNRNNGNNFSKTPYAFGNNVFLNVPFGYR
jgi:hypothetical protein